MVLHEQLDADWPPASANPADQVDPLRVRENREALQAAAERVREVANKDVAHRARVDVKDLIIPEMDAAFEAIEATLTKYCTLLHGASRMQAQPVPQFLWIERMRDCHTVVIGLRIKSYKLSPARGPQTASSYNSSRCHG